MDDKDRINAIVRAVNGVTAAINKLSVNLSGGPKKLLTDQEAALRLGFKRNRNTRKPDYKGFMNLIAPRLKIGKPMYVSSRRMWLADDVDSGARNASREIRRGRQGGK